MNPLHASQFLHGRQLNSVLRSVLHETEFDQCCQLPEDTALQIPCACFTHLLTGLNQSQSDLFDDFVSMFLRLFSAWHSQASNIV